MINEAKCKESIDSEFSEIWVIFMPKKVVIMMRIWNRLLIRLTVNSCVIIISCSKLVNEVKWIYLTYVKKQMKQIITFMKHWFWSFWNLSDIRAEKGFNNWENLKWTVDQVSTDIVGNSYVIISFKKSIDKFK